MVNIDFLPLIFVLCTSRNTQQMNGWKIIPKGNEQLGSENPQPDLNYDPMTSDTAPPESNQRKNRQRYTITESRLAEIRKLFMYPYYDKGGTVDNGGDYLTEIQVNTSKVHKNLNFQFPFFGFRFNYTRISLNGYLEFSDPPFNYEYPLVFPVKQWPKQNDPSFIGIFYSKCRIGALRESDVDRRKPGVYFRLERDLSTRKDRMGVEIRERLKWDIREGIIGSENFDPKHAIIVTWKNVSFYGGYWKASYVTNTFQMILVTDEVFSYAIFNYLDINWISHTEAGGDTSKGEGGVPAFVGFNAGNGTGSYYYQPFSQNSVIRDLISTGFGNGFKGRHMFRIDEDILLCSCTKDKYGAYVPLTIAPESGNMLGGTIVNITGPCFKPDDKIKCRFDVADIIDGFVVDTNRAICIQPMFYSEGWIRLRIEFNGVIWKGRYYIESPVAAARKIYFKNRQYHEKSPSEIKIVWHKHNLTTNENANISISLWGYRETSNIPNFVYISDITENMQNIGRYTIIPSQFRTRFVSRLDDITFGFIQINITESLKVYSNPQRIAEITKKIWSRPLPLGWYFQFQWENKYGHNWPERLCANWLNADRYMKNFTHELPQCPCTLEQALADKGRFIPDFECDKDTNPTCHYNTQAVHCVTTVSPSYGGAEQQCCYNINHFLILSHDTQWGSSPRRCHNLGTPPYNGATKVPTLSQWYHDIMPKYLCCLWQDPDANDCETLRLERRPTQDCVDYQGPGVAGVFGDPHVVTFDDVQYTFNGKGEFVLVKTDNLEVQGRFEEMPKNAYRNARATQLTSIVARGNNTIAIEVRQRSMDSKWRYRLDVIANMRRVFFDRSPLKLQHFAGVTVYTPTYILNQSEVIIMFDNGAGVEVIDNQGFMSARVYLPKSFLNKTVGLFGNWSLNQDDDFTLPDGQEVPVGNNISDMERIYNDFGMEWMVHDSFDKFRGESLFNYDFGRNSATYNNLTYKPQFSMLPKDIFRDSQEISRAYDICSKREYECLYDYAMTLSQDAAHSTLKYKASLNNLKEITRRKVVSCGALKTPRFGRKSTNLFIPGTKVTFHCDNGFVLVGDSERICQTNGTWNMPALGYTECLQNLTNQIGNLSTGNL